MNKQETSRSCVTFLPCTVFILMTIVIMILHEFLFLLSVNYHALGKIVKTFPNVFPVLYLEFASLKFFKTQG